MEQLSYIHGSARADYLSWYTAIYIAFPYGFGIKTIFKKFSKREGVFDTLLPLAIRSLY
ncbi:hypothetical protein SAMN05216167_12515 [Spirosoma endophyticum]|uniref:Uncharacterized protein n=1 Tax=Spirosoma endophyticum TaxID=662367 RepID=A0A1I2FC44_9BACT|nr:hypothetical protein SAMN05216167_12515 [Spirosoma endophyticum]